MKRLAAILLLLSGSVLAVSGQSSLPDDQRTNGSGTLKAISGVQQHAAKISVLLGKEKNKTQAGVILSPDGYVLTQASDVAQLRPLRAFLPGGEVSAVREVKRDERLNLLLLKLERQEMNAVSWGESLSLRAGQWVCALAGGRDIRMGVIGAKRRAIPNSGAMLGVRFGVDDEEPGVMVEELAADSPAYKAGLRADDVILFVNSTSVARNENVAKIISALHPGDVVKLRYSRQGKEAECEVRLASKRHVLMNWDGEDFANHGTSLRTDNFPEVLQHDLPLNPSDMGGALFDLQGRAIGLNIARTDRVTNYALPVEAFLPQVLQWMREDRVKKP